MIANEIGWTITETPHLGAHLVYHRSDHGRPVVPRDGHRGLVEFGERGGEVGRQNDD